MAEQVSKSKRPEGQSCVAGAPNNKSYTNNGKQHTEGISLHGFPKDSTVNGKKETVGRFRPSTSKRMAARKANTR